MHTALAHAVMEAAAFNPNQTIAHARAIGLGLVSITLLGITIVALWITARKGNPGKSSAIVAATLICLVPLVLSVGTAALAFGSTFWGWAVPGLG